LDVSCRAECSVSKNVDIHIPDGWMLVKCRRKLINITLYIVIVVCLSEKAFSRHEFRVIFDINRRLWSLVAICLVI
jgi:hypothetical protein